MPLAGFRLRIGTTVKVIGGRLQGLELLAESGCCSRIHQTLRMLLWFSSISSGRLSLRSFVELAASDQWLVFQHYWSLRNCRKISSAFPNPRILKLHTCGCLSREANVKS